MVISRTSPSGADAAGYLAGLNMIVSPDFKLMPSMSHGRMFDWDYFETGGVASGSIGRMGWNLLGAGTPAYARQSGSFQSTVKGLLSTSNVTNNSAILCLGEATNRGVMSNYDVKVAQYLVLLGSLANKRVFVGQQNQFNDNAQTTGSSLGFGYDSSFSPNWWIRSRVAANTTIAFTTDVVASATDAVLFSIEQFVNPAASAFIAPTNFYAASVTPGGVVTPNRLLLSAFPNQTLTSFNMGFKVQTLAAAPADLGIGYWCAVSPPIMGFFNARNDPPLGP